MKDKVQFHLPPTKGQRWSREDEISHLSESSQDSKNEKEQSLHMVTSTKTSRCTTQQTKP